MAQKTRAELTTENNSSFPNNTAGAITPAIHRTFNQDFIDSVALSTELFQDILKADLIQAITDSEIIIGTRYRITDATAGVVVVWGIDADVISTFGYVEGNYDGSTWTKSKPGNYQLATDFFIPTDNTYSGAPSNPNADTQGFANGDVWTDSTTKILYLCTDAATGAWEAQSGEYTPTITDNAADASATLLKAYFQRVGNLVYCNVQINLSITYSTGNGNIFITTPISSSATLDGDNTFGNYDFKGVGPGVGDIYSDLNTANISGNGTDSVAFELVFGPGISSPGRTYLSFVYPLS
jgi:hypothetical protein